MEVFLIVGRRHEFKRKKQTQCKPALARPTGFRPTGCPPEIPNGGPQYWESSQLTQISLSTLKPKGLRPPRSLDRVNSSWPPTTRNSTPMNSSAWMAGKVWIVKAPKALVAGQTYGAQERSEGTAGEDQTLHRRRWRLGASGHLVPRGVAGVFPESGQEVESAIQGSINRAGTGPEPSGAGRRRRGRRGPGRSRRFPRRGSVRRVGRGG